MKSITHKQLTSNTSFNKFLLSNANNSITYTLSMLYKERLESTVTQEDIRIVIYDILHLDSLSPSQFFSLDVTSKRHLIWFDEMIDRFEHDNTLEIRLALASKGYYLDKLTYDSHPHVRMHVARHKHNLDILMHDPNKDVRTTAILASKNNSTKSHPIHHDLKS